MRRTSGRYSTTIEQSDGQFTLILRLLRRSFWRLAGTIVRSRRIVISRCRLLTMAPAGDQWGDGSPFIQIVSASSAEVCRADAPAACVVAYDAYPQREGSRAHRSH